MSGTIGQPDRDTSRSTLTPRGAWGLGLVTAAAGLGVIAGALWADPGRVESPHWVVVAAGLAFVLAGVALIREFAVDRESERLDDLWTPLLGALIVTGFAAIASWVAFGPGDRQFRISGPIPLEWLWPGSGARIGRAAFGVGAVLSSAVALAFWARLARRLPQRPMRERIQVGVVLVASVIAWLGVLHATGDIRLWSGARRLRQTLAAPGLSDEERLQVAFRAKLANPAYVQWRALDWYRQPYQAFEEETLLKEIRARLTAAVTAPPGVAVTPIPHVTQRPPVIDGRLDPEEWTDAVRLDLGQGTQLYAVADDQRLYLGCDVPIDTTATGFDQLRVYYHVDLAGGIRHERIHVSGTPTRAFASYRLAHVVPLGGAPPR